MRKTPRPLRTPKKDYSSNKAAHKHVENPTIYKGDPPKSCSTRNIRVPSKKRKNARKRFAKAFPDLKLTDQNKAYYSPRWARDGLPPTIPAQKILNK